MTAHQERIETYRKEIKEYFEKKKKEMSAGDISNVLRDVVYFRKFYKSVEKCLDNIYPQLGGKNEQTKSKTRRTGKKQERRKD